MFHLFGFGLGVIIIIFLILLAIVISIVFGRSKGVSSVFGALAFIFLLFLTVYNWPIKLPDEEQWSTSMKIDMLLVPRILLIIFLFSFLFSIISVYTKHNVFNIVRAQSTAGRHAYDKSSQKMQKTE